MSEWKEIFQFSRAEIFAVSILLLMALIGGGVLLYQNSTQSLPPELFFQSAGATTAQPKVVGSIPSSRTDIAPVPERDSTALIDRAKRTNTSLLLNINTAPIDSLILLPRIGKVIGGRILELRERLGRFDSVGQLVAVRGIGGKTLELLRPHVTVGGSAKGVTSVVDTLATMKSSVK